jgi:hypothetical protein
VPHIDPEHLALLALGEAATDDTDRHLATCPDCRIELRELTAVVTTVRSGPGQLETPPPGLWARVAAAAGVEPIPAPSFSPASVAAPHAAGTTAAPGSAADDRPGRAAKAPWWRRRPLTAVLAGLIAGLVIGAGAAAGIGQLAASPAAHVVATIPLRPLPQFPQWRGAHGTAVMAQGPRGRQLSVTLSAPRKTGFYEVWLLARDGVSMISLGDLGPSQTGKFTMPPGVDLQNYSRIDVSLQAFNGSPLHSRTSVVRGTLP